MSLYRKYRPKVFADVFGQEHVVDTLQSGIEKGKLVHAYLFAGSRGTGKTSVARILARHLMLNGIEDEVMRKQIEKGVEDGSIVDLLEIDAASNRGIDHVRDLIEKIQFSPVVAAAKVYIVDEVHMLTKESFNALLKTLEEPPPYAYFILATTEFNKIPETIKSRCQCFPFKRVSETDIVRRLQYIADQEHIKVEREALRAIAHVSDGGMRDAISLLDQMRSMEVVTLEDVKQRIGSLGHEFVDQVLEAINNKSRKDVLTSIQKVEEAGVPLDVFTKQILKIVRESMHKAVDNKEQTNGVLLMMDVLLKAIRDIRISPVPGLVLEAALLSLCDESGSTPAIAVAEKVVATPPAPKTEPTPAPAPKIEASPPPPPPPPPPPEPAPIEATPVPEPTPEPPATEEATHPDALVEAPELSLESLRSAWPSVVADTTPASVKMSLKNGRVTAINNNSIQLSFASTFHKDRVAETDASRAVEEVLLKIFKQKLKIDCQVEGGNAPESVQDKALPDDTMVNMADAAAEIF